MSVYIVVGNARFASEDEAERYAKARVVALSEGATLSVVSVRSGQGTYPRQSDGISVLAVYRNRLGIAQYDAEATYAAQSGGAQ